MAEPTRDDPRADIGAAGHPPVLVTGATGKTGRRTVERLRATGRAVRVASRSATGPDAVRFDWHDPSTFGPAFAGAGAVYLVAPPGDPDPLGAMRPGIDAALGAGVRRFVLLSASSLEEGGPLMGRVHALLRERAPEWVVLRPSWFMQNLSESQHLPTIVDGGEICTATGDGRVGFVDAEDIAAVATATLTAPEIGNGEHVLTGPEALSYDELAATVSEVSGRRVVHRRLSTGELAARLTAHGVPAEFAEGLAAMDAAIAAGAEDRTTDAVERITGRAPGSFAAFARRHRDVWADPGGARAPD